MKAINKDELMKLVDNGVLYSLNGANQSIQELKVYDCEEVVRCRNCRFRDKYYDGSTVIRCLFTLCDNKDTHFCSLGEKDTVTEE